MHAVIDKCFGFDTAVEEAQRAIMAAKVEATSAYKGIGVVKLMGRQSGFITMQASMASGVIPLMDETKISGLQDKDDNLASQKWFSIRQSCGV